MALSDIDTGDGLLAAADPQIAWAHGFGTVETAFGHVESLVGKPLSEVAQAKVGFSTSPRWRTTGLSGNPTCTMAPHYLR